MNLLSSFKNFIQKEGLFSEKDNLLLAVSGGVDSVVLCELCNQAGFKFAIAHCNFQLRGAESERDENFVRALGKKYNREVFVKRFDTQKYTADNKVSVQVAARELRYGWFGEVVLSSEFSVQGSEPGVQERASYILTAHHLDDNVETLLMNFFKGTGIAGLRGMLPRQGNIVRPLLFANKETLLQFAAAHQLQWVEDSSNEQEKYTRNYFRHQVIPFIQKIYPEAVNNLAGNASRFRDIELLYHQSIDLHKKKLLEQKGNEVHIPVLKLQKAAPLDTIVYEIIKAYGFSAAQVPECIHLLDSETGKYIQSASHRIFKNRNWLIISPNQSTIAGNILIEATDAKVLFEAGKLQLEILPITDFSQTAINSSNNVALLDAAEIQFPLLLRKWKQGDYFYPLGMRKKKKLSRFFIDNKLSPTNKEKIWVVEMNKKIAWVVGMRIDDRFKVTNTTATVLKIGLKIL